MALNEIYADMRIATLITSQFFGFITMLGFGLTFIYTIFTLFLCYKASFMNDENLNDKLIVGIFFWLYINFYLILIIVLSEATKISVINYCFLIYKFLMI